MNDLSSVTNSQLVERFRKLGRIRSIALIKTVLCLGEICRRRIHVAEGYPTIAEYCRDIHREERSKAWRLGLAAEAVANFELVGELLRSRQLSVTALIAIKYALTRDNHEQLLRGAIGLTEREAEILASQFSPVPRRADSIRPVTVLEPVFVTPITPPPSGDGSAAQAEQTPVRGIAAQRVELVPKQRFEIHTRVSPDVHAQFEEVKNALSHKVPNGNLNDILAECFRITLEVCERRKIGAPVRKTDAAVPPLSPNITPARSDASQTLEPSASRKVAPTVVESGLLRHAGRAARQHEPDLSNGSPPPGACDPSSFAAFEAGLDERSRNVAVGVRRPVWERDEGCCSFRGEHGRRCASRYQLEFDHWLAFSLGGEHSVANVRLLCSAHNRYEAERVLGAKLMKKYFRRGDEVA